MDRLRVLMSQLNAGAGPAAAGGRVEPELCGVAASQEEVRPVASPEPASESDDEEALSNTPEVKKLRKEGLKARRMIFMEQQQFMEGGPEPSTQFFDGAFFDQHTNALTTAAAAKQLEKAEARGGFEIMDVLPGPWREAKTWDEKVALVKASARADTAGASIFLYADWQMKHGDNGLASNIIAPYMKLRGKGKDVSYDLVPQVIVADPTDAARIARIHVLKDGELEPGFLDSIISTRDNEHWMQQRRHLSEAFLPLSSLAGILPTSRARAKDCAERLAQTIAAKGDIVDMSDFLLHEAMAQLHLALLGLPADRSEELNPKVRHGFARDIIRGKAGDVSMAAREVLANTEDPALALPSDGCPVKGPLSRALKTADISAADQYGNALFILFAGHDTTGHTMTWLVFELARNPDLQARLQAEVDGFFRALDGRDPEYRDLAKLSFMDRCITETLRMWPAVAYGSFRQLQFPDTVTGDGGKEVLLPRGTCVQIINWSRHRNKDLWGPDADEFNPDRRFHERELAHVGCPMAGVSPQSERFSPFMYKPRSCLGRNFAQMEMRLIIAYLLRDFTFSLSPDNESLMGKTLGAVQEKDGFSAISFGTLGPKGHSSEHWWGTRSYPGLMMRATPRA